MTKEEDPWSSVNVSRSLPSGRVRDAWEVAMHLVSDHADPMAVCRSYEDNTDQHDYEHRGPGTIRDHPPESRHIDPEKVELVLEEAEAAP